MRYLPFFLVLLLAIGCSSSRSAVVPDSSLPAGFPDHSAGEILDRLPPYPESLQRITAEARVALSSPQESGRFTARIAYLHPESLLVRVTFPLGIEGARVLSTPEQAWVYDRIAKVVWTGSPERVADVLPGAVAGTDLEIPRRDVVWRVDVDSTLYLLSNPAGTLRYTVDPSIWRIVAVRERAPDGSLIEQRWYTDFVTVEGTLLPRRMALIRPLDSLRISMAFQQFDTTPDDGLSFGLDVDRDAQWIDLGQ
ncbi:MAG: DUF4292 domain-containing protein [Bacteroidetes bacterium]|nr:DUF4292 domain-containing protein [Bacteroidota bacterium]